MEKSAEEFGHIQRHIARIIRRSGATACAAAHFGPVNKSGIIAPAGKNKTPGNRWLDGVVRGLENIGKHISPDRGISDKSVLKMIREKNLPAIKLPGAGWISHIDLIEEWMTTEFRDNLRKTST